MARTSIALLGLLLLALSITVACGPDPDEELFVDALRLYRAQEMQQALPLLEEVLERDSSHARALMLSAKIYFYRQEFERSAEFCERLLSDRPDHTGAMLLLARVHLGDRGQTDEVLRLADRVLEIDSSNVEAWYLKGVAHEQREEIPEAFASFQGALHAGNNLALVHRRLSLLYDAAKLREQSRLHASLARMIAPSDSPLEVPDNTGTPPPAAPASTQP
jgi:tetratricopeptide (TPR) repeat protein